MSLSLRWQFLAWPIQTFRTSQSMAIGNFWLWQLDLSALPRDGRTRRQASPSPVGVDASPPLGDVFGYDEHRALARFSEFAAGAGDQSGASDVAGARHISRRNQSPLRGNLLSWPRHGAFGAGDHLAQTVRPLFALGGRGSRRA